MDSRTTGKPPPFLPLSYSASGHRSISHPPPLLLAMVPTGCRVFSLFLNLRSIEFPPPQNKCFACGEIRLHRSEKAELSTNLDGASLSLVIFYLAARRRCRHLFACTGALCGCVVGVVVCACLFRVCCVGVVVVGEAGFPSKTPVLDWAIICALSYIFKLWHK